MRNQSSAIQGMILYDGVNGSKAVRKLVDRRIRDWFGAKAGATMSHLRYLVKFSREKGIRQVACEVEIDTGREKWRGRFYGKEIHQSFVQAIRHLMQLSLPTPPGGASAMIPALAVAGSGRPRSRD